MVPKDLFLPIVPIALIESENSYLNIAILHVLDLFVYCVFFLAVDCHVQVCN